MLVNNEKREMTMINYYYQIALDSVGLAYLDAEQQLIAQGQAVVPFLQEQLPNAAPLPKFITQAILQRISGNPHVEACLQYLEQVGPRFEPTIMRVPPAEGVANYLLKHFSDNVASLLAVYLIKLGHIWPSWETLGVILYLGKLNSASSADALIRFMFTTTDERYREVASQSLVAVGDASALSKIEAEIKPMDAARNALQQAADQIRAKLKTQR